MVRTQRRNHQEQTMQNTQKPKAAPVKPLAFRKAEPAKPGPVRIDEKSLRQVAGGMAQIPNGGW
jgi:hypothetical protein